MVSPAFASSVAVSVRAPAALRVASRVAPQQPRMSVARDARRALARFANAAPAALVAAAAPALASEGTGEALGVDNAFLLLPLFAVPVLFLVLFLQFDGSQEKSDFNGAIDDRRR